MKIRFFILYIFFTSCSSDIFNEDIVLPEIFIDSVLAFDSSYTLYGHVVNPQKISISKLGVFYDRKEYISSWGRELGVGDNLQMIDYSGSFFSFPLNAIEPLNNYEIKVFAVTKKHDYVVESSKIEYVAPQFEYRPPTYHYEPNIIHRFEILESDYNKLSLEATTRIEYNYNTLNTDVFFELDNNYSYHIRFKGVIQTGVYEIGNPSSNMLFVRQNYLSSSYIDFEPGGLVYVVADYNQASVSFEGLAVNHINYSYLMSGKVYGPISVKY